LDAITTRQPLSPDTFAQKTQMKKLIGLAKGRREKKMRVIPGMKTKLFFTGSILFLSLSISISQASKCFCVGQEPPVAYTFFGRRIYETKTELINRRMMPKMEETLVTTSRRKAEFIAR
jgi:hypothetical protein